MKKRKAEKISTFGKRKEKKFKKEKLKAASEEPIESALHIASENFPELVEEEEDIDAKLEQLKKDGRQFSMLSVDESTLSNEYKAYFEHKLSENVISELKNKYKTSGTLSWEVLHHIILLSRTGSASEKKKVLAEDLKLPIDSPSNADKLHRNFGVHKTLASNWFKTNDLESGFTPLQQEIFCLINQYKSLYYPSIVSSVDEQQTRAIYCLHALNHVAKARGKVSKNNRHIAKLALSQRETAEYRDQGFTRPKVLILAPFRDSCLKIVNNFIELLATDKKFEISNFKRFQREFNILPSEDGSSDVESKRLLAKKPSDYQRIFSGNTDEHYRIGISLLNSAFRLYAPFYFSDIIIASPLGLRTVIGEKGEPHYEYDFLSSVEMCILDSTDVFLMQNWEHVIHIMKHLNLQPTSAHDVDFSRVRNSTLDGLNRHYCQTLLFSRVSLPQISSILTKHCYNYKGLAMVQNVIETGSICSITKPMPQIFHKLNISTEPFSEVQNLRFEFFVRNILKQFVEKKLSNTLIYLPQYFDYVRLRNHLRRESKSVSNAASFACICEYMKPQAVRIARKKFLSGEASILLYTERYHFYNRPHLKGIENLIFYELPSFPQIYSELCNSIRPQEGDEVPSNSIITLYSKYDSAKLVAVLGNKRTEALLSSSKKVHMFFTENTA